MCARFLKTLSFAQGNSLSAIRPQAMRETAAQVRITSIESLHSQSVDVFLFFFLPVADPESGLHFFVPVLRRLLRTLSAPVST
jgi:hypothetical protein